MTKTRRRRSGGDSTILWAAAPAAVLLFAMLILGIMQFALLQRSLDRQTVLSAAAYAQHDRLLQIVNEETGIRGYVATSDPVYLGIYYASQARWMQDAAAVARTQAAIPKLQGRVFRSIVAAQNVQVYFRREISLMHAHHTSQAKRGLSQGKVLFDRLRGLDAAVQTEANTEVEAQREHSRLLARAGFVGGIAVCVIMTLWVAAFALVLRRARIYRLSALRDSLTGVQNRRGAIAAIDAEVGAAKPESFGLVFIDLDGFKKINDAYGHATGDAILRGVAARLQAQVRGDDVICRLGGDEFVCVLSSPVSNEEVRAVAERLRKAVCQPYEIDADSYVVGCSVGVSMYPQHGVTSEALLARADSAMYAAKARGGGVREATTLAGRAK